MSLREVPFMFQPLRAARAVVALIRDPDDTAQVFTVAEALSLDFERRLLARFAADRSGRRLLATRPQLLAVLGDRARLEAMPEGSLGRSYLAFLDAEGITAAGLVDASVQGSPARDTRSEDLRFVTDRIRDTHDLWHTVTGYHGDVKGEAALLAFGLPHLPNPGIAVIVLAGLLRMHDADFTRAVVTGFLRGREAQWLPGVDWEPLLPLPLDEVRRRLGVTAAEPYVAVRAHEVRRDPPRAASADRAYAPARAA